MDSHPHGYILRTFPLTVPIFHQGSVSALPLLPELMIMIDHEPAAAALAGWPATAWQRRLG
jgi:hypothetical protein